MENNQTNNKQMTPEELAAWADRKQEQRETVNGLSDRMLEEVFSDPQELNAHLKRQATFGKMGVTNVLLIGAQNAEATEVHTFDEWKERGRSVTKGEKAIAILAPKGEYTGEDGITRNNFVIKNVFDVKQTYGKELRRRKPAPVRVVVKALMANCPIPVVTSDKVKDAQFEPTPYQIAVNRDQSPESKLNAIAREYAKTYDMGEFVAQCAANIVCYRYGVNPTPIEQIPEKAALADPAKQKSLLGFMKTAATELSEHIDRQLQAERQRKQEER